jgi:hypothetical protein
MVLERVKRPMTSFRTSNSKKKKTVAYFIQHCEIGWSVVEYPTNDIVRTYAKKHDAELFSEQLNTVKPFGEDKMPTFLKGNIPFKDTSELL